MNSIELFFITIFSKMGDFWNDKNLPLKIPFSFTAEEINSYYIHAPQFGTFGMLYGGIFLITNIILLILLAKFKNKILKNKILKSSIIFYLIIFTQCMISPVGIGGLRYVAHFWLTTNYILALSFYYINSNAFKKKNIYNAGILLIIIIAFINISPYFKTYSEAFKESKYSASTLKEISLSASKLKIALSTEDFYGMLFNLRDYGIRYGDYDFMTSDDLGKDCSYTCGWQIRYRID